jgi:hypothetical protein
MHVTEVVAALLRVCRGEETFLGRHKFSHTYFTAVADLEARAGPRAGRPRPRALGRGPAGRARRSPDRRHRSHAAGAGRAVGRPLARDHPPQPVHPLLPRSRPRGRARRAVADRRVAGGPLPAARDRQPRAPRSGRRSRRVVDARPRVDRRAQGPPPLGRPVAVADGARSPGRDRRGQPRPARVRLRSDRARRRAALLRRAPAWPATTGIASHAALAHARRRPAPTIAVLPELCAHRRPPRGADRRSARSPSCALVLAGQPPHAPGPTTTCPAATSPRCCAHGKVVAEHAKLSDYFLRDGRCVHLLRAHRARRHGIVVLLSERLSQRGGPHLQGPPARRLAEPGRAPRARDSCSCRP